MKLKDVLALVGGLTLLYLFGTAGVALIDSVLAALGRK